MTRTYSPTAADFRKWRRLVKQALVVAAQPRGPAGDLRAAAATARRAQAPDSDLHLKVCSPLLRLAEAWPTLSDACLDTSAETLRRLAETLAPHVNAPNPGMAAMKALIAHRPARAPKAEAGDLFSDQAAREPRKDIFG